jgi:Cu/Zn superoxide dismutase
MRTRNALLFALTGLVVAACDTRDRTDTEPGLLPADDATRTEQPQDMVVARGDFQPTAQAGDLNVSGWAEVRQRGATLDDGLELRVHVMGLSEGDHAWHIHQGTCASPGAVVLALSDHGEHDGIASDLNAGSDGMVEETVNIDRDRYATLNLQQDHVVMVHLRGGDDAGPAIACAPLNLSGAGTQPAGTTGAAGTTGY